MSVSAAARRLCRIVGTSLLIWMILRVPAVLAENPVSDATVRLAFVGDIMVGRHVGEIIVQQGMSYPFAHVAPILHSADLAFGNMESPLTTAPRVAGGYDLRADPSLAEAVALAGFDLLSVANNHATDNGRPGLLETIQALADWGMASVGCGENRETAQGPWRTEINGLRLSFFAYEGLRATYQASASAAGCMWLDPETAGRAIAEARPDSDLIIVSVHWGEEYHSLPNAYQRRVAQQLADAGADIIIGHHPHVVQPVEWVQGKDRAHPTLVAYSLGNFLFDQWFSEETMQSTVLLVVAGRDGVREFGLVPTLSQHGRVTLAEGAPAEAVLGRLLPGNSPSAVWRVLWPAPGSGAPAVWWMRDNPSAAGGPALSGAHVPPVWLEPFAPARSSLGHPNEMLWRWEMRPANPSAPARFRRPYALSILASACADHPEARCATLEPAGGNRLAVYGWHWTEEGWRRQMLASVEQVSELRWRDVTWDGRPELLVRPMGRVYER
ncbi:MAG: CapA family protein [Anaerolineae bacterium]|nr:CapA family protein [Anaerolineae bacterium]